jgi:hypothetical protein
MSHERLAPLGLEPMVSTKVACAALGVTPKTIVAWIKADDLQGDKVGDRWLVMLSSLLAIQQRAKDRTSDALGRARMTGDASFDALKRALGPRPPAATSE